MSCGFYSIVSQCIATSFITATTHMNINIGYLYSTALLTEEKRNDLWLNVKGNFWKNTLIIYTKALI